MLNNLRPDLCELFDLVRDEAAYRATLAAKQDIKPAPHADAEYERKVLRIRKLRERWGSCRSRQVGRYFASFQRLACRIFIASPTWP